MLNDILKYVYDIYLIFTLLSLITGHDIAITHIQHLIIQCMHNYSLLYERNVNIKVFKPFAIIIMVLLTKYNTIYVIATTIKCKSKTTSLLCMNFTNNISDPDDYCFLKCGIL